MGLTAERPLGLTVFVCASGDDGAEGSRDRPFATLRRAQQVAREALEAADQRVTVCVRGELCLEEPLVLDGRDAGRAGAPMTYTGWGDEPAVLTTGTAPTNPRPLEDEGLPVAAAARGKLWVMDLPPGLRPASLRIDGQVQSRARWPKTDQWEEWPIGSPGATGETLCVPPDAQKRHTNLSDITVNILSSPYTHWINYLTSVEAVDGDQVRLSRALSPNAFLKPREDIAYRYENALEALTEPGEWCVDTHAGRLYVWPEPGVDLRRAEVAVPVLSCLLRVAGTEDAPVRHVRVAGMRLTGANAGGAAMELANVENVAIEACQLVDLGGAGIAVSGMSRQVSVVGCRVARCGGAGIVAQSPPGPYRGAGHHLIEQNEITDIGRTDWHAGGISLGGTGHSVVRRNYVHDLPYAGILAGGMRLVFLVTGTLGKGAWKLPPEELAAHNIISIKKYVGGHNVIEGNLVADTMKRLDDGGAIYCHASHHNVLRGNLVLRTCRASSHGLYFDDDEVESTMEGNVVVDCPMVPQHGSGLHVHDNARNTIRGNLVMGPARPFTFPSCYGGHEITGNIFAFGPDADAAILPKRNSGRYPETRWDGGENTFDRNIWWSTDNGTAAHQLVGRLRKSGYGEEARVQDPGVLVGPDGALTIEPASAAAALGLGVPPAIQGPWAAGAPSGVNES